MRFATRKAVIVRECTLQLSAEFVQRTARVELVIESCRCLEYGLAQHRRRSCFRRPRGDLDPRRYGFAHGQHAAIRGSRARHSAPARIMPSDEPAARSPSGMIRASARQLRKLTEQHRMTLDRVAIALQFELLVG